MICTCSKRLQAAWKFCPECGREIVITADERLSSHGVQYWPEAFAPDAYKFGRAVADDTAFYQVFIRYILSLVADISQLVYFRAQIVHEASRVAGEKHDQPIGHILWCALSLCSDRYFAEKALIYDWKASEEEEIKSAWYELIAPAFLAHRTRKQIDAQTISDWVKRFLALHKRAQGPLLTCAPCATKCHYQYEVSEITGNAEMQSDFFDTINRESAAAAEAATHFCRFTAESLIGKDSVDLGYCLAIHFLKNMNVPAPARTGLSADVQLVLADKIRNSLNLRDVRRQVFDVVVKRALNGTQWRELFAAPMELNNITVAEVEAEVQRLKKEALSVSA